MSEKINNNCESVQDQWGQICGQLKTEFGETAYDSWLKPLTLGSFSDGIMNICVPTRFMKSWVITYYSERIRKIWENKNPNIKSINFVVKSLSEGTQNSIYSPSCSIYSPSCRDLLKKIPSTPASQLYAANGDSDSSAANNNIQSFDDANRSVSVPLNPLYTFENFVVGKSNEFAYAAARKVTESKNIAFNPLFLYSGVGLGKTHLMHAIAWKIKQQDPSKNIVYLSAEKLCVLCAIKIRQLLRSSSVRLMF